MSDHWPKSSFVAGVLPKVSASIYSSTLMYPQHCCECRGDHFHNYIDPVSLKRTIDISLCVTDTEIF